MRELGYRLSAIGYRLFLFGLLVSTSHAAEPKFTDAHIGLDGLYKLGCWTPIEVSLRGGSKAETGHVELTLADTDGVPTTVRSAHDKPVRVEPGETSLVRLYVRSGQSISPLAARFIVDGNVRAKRIFYVAENSQDGGITGGLPATNRLLLVLGPAIGLEELLKTEFED